MIHPPVHSLMNFFHYKFIQHGFLWNHHIQHQAYFIYHMSSQNVSKLCVYTISTIHDFIDVTINIFQLSSSFDIKDFYRVYLLYTGHEFRIQDDTIYILHHHLHNEHYITNEIHSRSEMITTLQYLLNEPIIQHYEPTILYKH